MGPGEQPLPWDFLLIVFIGIPVGIFYLLQTLFSRPKK